MSPDSRTIIAESWDRAGVIKTIWIISTSKPEEK